MKGVLMKLTLFVFLFLLMSISGRAAEVETASPSTTQADWFSPACPTCAKLLTPGTANLGNSKGVFRPGDKAKNKKKSVNTSRTVNKEQ